MDLGVIPKRQLPMEVDSPAIKKCFSYSNDNLGNLILRQKIVTVTRAANQDSQTDQTNALPTTSSTRQGNIVRNLQSLEQDSTEVSENLKNRSGGASMNTSRRGRGPLRGKGRKSTSTQSPMRQALISSLWEVQKQSSTDDKDEDQ